MTNRASRLLEEHVANGQRLAALLRTVGDVVQLETLTSLLSAGEHLVMLEILLDQLFESRVSLSREALLELRSLSHELGVSEAERRWIDERLRAMPP